MFKPPIDDMMLTNHLNFWFELAWNVQNTWQLSCCHLKSSTHGNIHFHSASLKIQRKIEIVKLCFFPHDLDFEEKHMKNPSLFQGQDPALSKKSNKTCDSCVLAHKKSWKQRQLEAHRLFRFPSGKSGIFFVGEVKNDSIPLQCTELPSVRG